MMKHFPTFKMKFTPDALALTVVPDRFSVLISQRRRWIHSTIHNLVELVFLPELCGFCLFSIRFVVFLDLLGTIILLATTVYLIYLIVTVSTGKAPIPIIFLAMIAAVYGLPAIIFILKRGEPFIAKLFSGPGLMAESYSKDPTTVTQAQAVSRAIRAPCPFEGVDSDENAYAELDPRKVYSIGTQLNTATSELFRTLDATRMWTILCIRPNASGAPNSFDKRRLWRCADIFFWTG